MNIFPDAGLVEIEFQFCPQYGVSGVFSSLGGGGEKVLLLPEGIGYAGEHGIERFGEFLQFVTGIAYRDEVNSGAGWR